MSDEKISLDSFLKMWLENSVREVVRDELNKFFEERFKNDNGSIQSVHNNIDELRNVRLKKLQDDIDGLRGKLDNLSGVIFQKDGEERKKLDWKLSSYETQNEKLRIELSNQKKLLEDSQRDYDKKSRELEQLRKEANDELDKLENSLNENKKLLEESKRSYDKKSQELEQLRKEANEEVDRLNEEIEQLQADNSAIADALTEKEGQLNDVRESEKRTGERLKAWTNSADVYSPVRAAITKCPTFQAIVDAYGLNDMSETGLLAYAQAMGKTNENFVYEIWKTAVDLKKQNKEFMTVEEAEVYGALNQVYRQIWNIEHDIFVLPGGKSVTENFQKTTFDFTTSMYLPEPRNKGLAYTTGIYVPILMGKENRLSQKAYVDAGNR